MTSITCPRCGWTSHNPHDVAERYCGHCHVFLDDGGGDRLNSPDYVIWSFEHDAWWRPGSWGYTRELAEAGRFTRAAADRIVAAANIVAINEQALLLSEAQVSGPSGCWRAVCSGADESSVFVPGRRILA